MSWRTRDAIVALGGQADGHRSRQLAAADLRAAPISCSPWRASTSQYVRRRYPEAAPRTGTLKRLARDLPATSGTLAERVGVARPRRGRARAVGRRRRPRRGHARGLPRVRSRDPRAAHRPAAGLGRRRRVNRAHLGPRVAIVVAALVLIAAAAGSRRAAQTTTTTPPRRPQPRRPAAGARGVTDTSIRVGGLGYSCGLRRRRRRCQGALPARQRRRRRERPDDRVPRLRRRRRRPHRRQPRRRRSWSNRTACSRSYRRSPPTSRRRPYLVEQKVPYFGWALSSNFCGNRYGFGFTGCPVPKNATSNAWPLLDQQGARRRGRRAARSRSSPRTRRRVSTTSAR